MNREIKFRGLHGDKWLIGDLISPSVEDDHFEETQDVGRESALEWQIIPPNSLDGPGCFGVRPQTIGQFTGFFDTEGKEIFEHDLVIAKKPNTYLNGKIFVVQWDTKLGKWGYFSPTKLKEIFYSQRYTVGAGKDPSIVCSVVGNIFQNPELLR